MTLHSPSSKSPLQYRMRLSLCLLMRLSCAHSWCHLSLSPPHYRPGALSPHQLMHTSTPLQLNKFKQSPHAPAATSPGSSDNNNAAAVAADHHTTHPAASLSPSSATNKPQVIIITGPTAVGKTKLGLQLAKHIGGEIISADSVQVYCGLDVGSDKLPVEQREGVPHHLIDILEPDQEFSAGDFHRLGRQAAEDILVRGKVPIVAGGTGFYLRWFTFGRPSTPASSPESAARALELIGQAWVAAAAEVAAAQAVVTQQQQPQLSVPAQEDKPLNQQQQRQQGVLSTSSSGGNRPPAQQPGIECPSSLGSRPQQEQPPSDSTTSSSGAATTTTTADAAASAKLPPVSPTAVQAALQLPDELRWDVAVDVVQEMGDPETAARIRGERNNWYRLQRVLQILLQNGGKPLSEMDVDTTRELDYDFRCFFLHRPRLELFDRIVYRVEEMVAGGLLQEALMLLDRGMQPNSNIATRAIGYRQALDFMKTALSKGSASREELQQLIFDIATASRNLVKNQTTWFRDDAMFRWVEVSGRSTDDVLQEVLTELDRPHHQGGCGDSGRFDKATLSALKRYVPTLKLFDDPQRVAATLDWVAEVAAARKGQQQGTGANSGGGGGGGEEAASDAAQAGGN